MNRKPKKPLTTEEQLVQRAKRLPAPQPGLVINVPLRLYPAYMALHGIEPVRYDRPILIVKKQEAG